MHREPPAGEASSLDRCLHTAYERDNPPAVTELGFTGWRDALEPNERPISAWLPGDRTEADSWLARGLPFRFLFAERYHAPAIEARRLLHAHHLGTPTQTLIHVQCHPGILEAPQAAASPAAWLDEPLLNRLAAAVWLLGPVRDARWLDHRGTDATAHVVLLRHRQTPRLTILQIAVSTGCTQAGRPTIRDRIEITGSDGFLVINGIWQPHPESPRLQLHRGPLEIVQRDLPRDRASLCRAIASDAQRIDRQSRLSHELARGYRDACARVHAALGARGTGGWGAGDSEF